MSSPDYAALMDLKKKVFILYKLSVACVGQPEYGAYPINSWTVWLTGTFQLITDV